MAKKADELEKDAREFLDKKQSKEAFELYDKAASLYKKIGNHCKAAKCFASAGTSWGIRLGEELYFNAASRYQYAAEEAVKYHDYRYARYLYHLAARFFEKDGSTKWFSLCFYRSKVCERDYSWLAFTNSKKIKTIPGQGYKFSIGSMIKHFFIWLLNSSLCIIWGYGEKPYRTLLSVLSVILISSIIFYMSGMLVYNGEIIIPSFFDSFYFSVITFTTLGYGDYQPVGIYRIVSMIEALSALFLMPLFVIALTRKYLRTYY